MKRFLIKLFLFLALVGISCFSIMMLPVDKRYQYAFSKSDCTPKSNYIYHRLYEDSTPIDIAFIGTSHTMCGISDSIVHRKLRTHRIDRCLANLAICRVGRNMDYVIIKDLLKTKRPQLIVLEVKQEEPDLSHPEFGYRADIADVLVPYSIVDVQYFTDFINAFRVRVSYLQSKLGIKEYDATWEEPSQAIYRQHGVADTAILRRGAQRRWERYYSQPRNAWVDSLMLRYPMSYISGIMQMARESHARVLMLYIPNYGYPWHKPRHLSYYRQLADVYLMPDSFYDNKNYWIEDEHLNADGAAILSDSIAAYIARQLR
ncbi:MAG: hypothetical protein JST90_00630 [Bacteroidetes bacterium]|nr:hypothetical protein [Bacteroidota bacterium]